MRAVPIGISRRQSFMPQAQDSAAALGNVGVEAVATVTLILWVEATCGPLLVPYFEAGEGGVGFRVALDHTGPAFAGRPVEVHAEVTAVAGRKVTFRVRVEQDGRTVMAGEHVRAIIVGQDFVIDGEKVVPVLADKVAATNPLNGARS